MGRDSWKLAGLLWVCYLTAQIILFLTMQPLWDRLSVEQIVLLNSGVLFLVFLLPTVLFVLKRGYHLRVAFRWRRTSWWVVTLTVLGTLALGAAVSQVTLWLIHFFDSFFERSKLAELLSASTRTRSPGLFLLAVMLPALPEELTFRGAIQQGFERHYSPAVAIALTSVLFAFFHLDLIQALSVVIIAAFWGWVVWRSQSILPSLVAHAFQNGLTILSILGTTAKGGDFQEPLKVLSTSPNWVVAVAGLAFWLSTVLLLTRYLPRRDEEDDARSALRCQVSADENGIIGNFSANERGGPSQSPNS